MLVLLGARTGRDGIGGASVLASAELGEEDASKRPTVQIGDPFEESKLVECCLELLERETLASLQDLGAAGLSSLVVGDGVQGRGRARHRRVAGAAARGRHGAVRDHDLGVPGADAVRGRAGAARPSVLEVCERWEVRATAIGAVTDTRRLRVFDGDELVGDMPVEALVDDCPLYDLEPRAAGRAGLPGAAGAAGAEAGARGDAARAAARRPTSPPSAACSSSTTRSSARARCAGPQSADAAVLPLGQRRRQRGDRGLDRRQRPARGLRPLRGRRRGGARVRAQPRLRRRRAARPDQLPQLRQPREAAHRLAADARGGGAARRLPRARRAGGGRQRLALQRGRRAARSTRRPIVGMVGKLPDPERVPRIGFAERRPRDRAGRAVRAARSRGRSSRSCAARLADVAAGGRPRGAGARRWRRCARRCARGELATVHDVAEGGLAVALAECCIEGGLGRAARARRTPATTTLFGEGPGGVRDRRAARGGRGGAGRAGDRRGRRRRARDRGRVRGRRSASCATPTRAPSRLAFA